MSISDIKGLLNDNNLQIYIVNLSNPLEYTLLWMKL